VLGMPVSAEHGAAQGAVEEDRPALYLHEWLAIATIISLLIALTALTHFTKSPDLPQIEASHYILEPKIEVFVDGAVERPGRLIVNKGTKVKELLDQVGLLPEANTSKLKLEAKVRRGQHLRVPAKKAKKKERGQA